MCNFCLRISILFCCFHPAIFGQNGELNDSLKTIQLSEVSIIGTSPTKVVGSGAWVNFAKLQKLNQPDINKVIQTIPGINVRDEEGFGLRDRKSVV